MTRSEFEMFLAAGAGLCGLMILVSLARYRSRGVNSLLMGGAFAAMGGMLLALRQQAPRPVLYIFGAAMIACLFGDFALRAKHQGEQ